MRLPRTADFIGIGRYHLSPTVAIKACPISYAIPFTPEPHLGPRIKLIAFLFLPTSLPNLFENITTTLRRSNKIYIIQICCRVRNGQFKKARIRGQQDDLNRRIQFYECR